MKKLILFLLVISSLAFSQNQFESDTVSTKDGNLIITFIGHGTLMFEFRGMVIHVDPVSRYADYTLLPKADLILVTHHHGDHLDPAALEALSKKELRLIYTASCAESYPGGKVLKNGEKTEISGITIEAVPAYNLVHKRDNGEFFHPKGVGNGYIMTLAGKRIYIAGDTENIPGMKTFGPIDIAFIPMNLPYTMTPEMTADAARMVSPAIFYPYHFGSTDTAQLIDLLKNETDMEIRVRAMQ